jgi:hypothetical protein
MTIRYYQKERQQRTRAMIAEAIRKDPKITTQALCELTNIYATSNIHYHIRRLEAEGVIRWEGRLKMGARNTGGKHSKRWQCGDVKLPRLSHARQAELIEQVVIKAQGSGRHGEEEPNEDVIRGFGHKLRIADLDASHLFPAIPAIFPDSYFGISVRNWFQ